MTPARIDNAHRVVAVPAFWLMPEAMAASFCAVSFYCVVQYEWVHFIVHTRVQPRSRFAQEVFLNHRLHHFRNARYWYSFSLPWVDRYYGTGPDASSVPVVQSLPGDPSNAVVS